MLPTETKLIRFTKPLSVVISLILVIFLTERTRVIMDSIIEERTEILKCSLFLSVQPAYMLSRGATNVDEMCEVVSQIGRATLEARSAVGLAFMILPIMGLMYIRLPFYLSRIQIRSASLLKLLGQLCVRPLNHLAF